MIFVKQLMGKVAEMLMMAAGRRPRIRGFSSAPERTATTRPERSPRTRIFYCDLVPPPLL